MEIVKTKDAIEQLIEESYTIVDTRIQKKDFEKFMTLMKDLIAEADSEEGKYCPDATSVEPDRGLFLRGSSKEQGKRDDKWCFHYRPSLFSEIEKKFGQQIYDQDLLSEVCSVGHNLYCQLREHTDAMMRELDRILPEYGILSQYQHPWSEDLHSLRAIAYKRPKADQNVAGYHYDRNFITASGYESHPGLNLVINGAKIPYDYKEGKVLLFLGDKAEKLTDGKLKGMVHGVDVLEKGTQRDAIVFFGHTLRPFMAKAKKPELVC